MRPVVTLHALQRFIERCAPGVSAPEAQRRLQEAMARGVVSKQRTPRGDMILSAREQECFVVVRPKGRRWIAVTVYDKLQFAEQDDGADERTEGQPVAMPEYDELAELKRTLGILRSYVSRRARKGDREAHQTLQRANLEAADEWNPL